ncbi:MAG: VOC family protein [Gemmatimonadaceae bacterium]|jgi:catechol 2,3-dioxygenase-like lactoylglutathione lyase family enzyme
MAMVKTLGLTHLALTVSDVNRSFQFYHDVFGMLAVYREPHLLQAQTPGAHDVLVLEEGTADVGKSGGIKHFGFRLTDARDIDKAATAVEKAGGTIRDRGEFVPGEPYVFFSDPDGYEAEIWYELPNDTSR